MFGFIKKLDYSDFTLIIPSISVGNVPQLTCDLLISTFNLTKVATVWHRAIIPVYGANPFDKTSQDNCMACELYASEENKFAVYQIRSTIEPRMVNIFLNDLKTEITKLQFKNIIVLTSSYAYEMHNLNSGVFRYATNAPIIKEILDGKQILELENTGSRLMIHGAGFAPKFYELFKDSFNATIIVKYASEGDNRPDAFSMFQVVCVCLKIEEEKAQKIICPQSWELVYGSPPPIGIY